MGIANGVDSPIMDVLSRLAELQADTAPIDITIGWTYRGDGVSTVKHDAIVIRNCAPRVLQAVVNEFPMVSQTPDGLHIPVRR